VINTVAQGVLGCNGSLSVNQVLKSKDLHTEEDLAHCIISVP